VWRILIVGAVMAAIAFLVYNVERSNPGNSLAVAQTAAVNAVVFAQIFLLFNCRSRRYTAFRLGFFSNRWLLLGATLMVLAQLLFTYTPLMQRIFRTAAIQGREWMIILGASLALYLGIELLKLVLRRGEPRPLSALA
jgi:Ca2+-transporting ATPase